MADTVEELLKNAAVAKALREFDKSLQIPDYERLRREVMEDPAVRSALKDAQEQEQSAARDIPRLLAEGLNRVFISGTDSPSVNRSALDSALSPKEAQAELARLDRESKANAEKIAAFKTNLEKEVKKVKEEWSARLGNKVPTKEDYNELDAAYLAFINSQKTMAEPLLAEQEKVAGRKQRIADHTITDEVKEKLIALDRQATEAEEKVKQAIAAKLQALGVDPGKDNALVTLITGSIRNDTPISKTPPAPSRRQKDLTPG